MGISVSTSTCSLLVTYPLHFSYFSLQKGMSFGNVVRSARTHPRVLWSGATPAVLSVMFGITVDPVMFRKLRRRTENMNGNAITRQAALVTLTVAPSLVGGILLKPFKVVSKSMSIESAKVASYASLRGTVEILINGGVGEFGEGSHGKVCGTGFQLLLQRQRCNACMTSCTKGELRLKFGAVET